MSKLSKVLDQILRGSSDANIDFNDLRSLLGALKFRERVRGSHHIFTRASVTGLSICNQKVPKQNLTKSDR